jgi:hypothetical protein
MLDPDILSRLKSKYGSIFQTALKKETIIFRELTFSEFDRISEYEAAGESAAEIEDLIIKSAVIYPENMVLDNYPAGLISSLSEEILQESGFASASRAKRVLDEKRAQASEVRSLMKAFVLSTIATYSPEDLDDMTYSKLAEKVALAEKIIEIQQNVLGIEPTNVTLQLIDPEEEQQKNAQKVENFNKSRKEGEAKFDDPVAQKLWGMR